MLTYIFKKSQTNYIKALTKYLKDVGIKSIESSDGKLNVEKKNYTLAQLPELLARFSDDEQLTFTCYPGRAADHILPAFNRSLMQKGIGQIDFSELDVGKDIYEILSYYIVKHEDPVKRHQQVFVSVDGFNERLREKYPTLTQKQAMLFLNELDGHYKVMNAMLLPGLDTILYRLENEFYYIRFGANVEFNKLKNFVLDIDPDTSIEVGVRTGFIIEKSWQDQGKVTVSQCIADALNGHYKSWRDADFAGEMLPTSGAGLAELSPSRTATAAVTARPSAGGIFGSPAPQPSVAIDIEEHPWCATGATL